MPVLHDLVTTLAAPWVALSPRSGQLTGTGAEGVYARDRRILSHLQVSVDGRAPLPVHVDEPAAGTTTFSAVVEGLGDAGKDPTVVLRRTRTVDGGGLTERIVLVNRSHDTVECTLSVAIGTDLAGTAEVRSGAAADRPAAPATWEKAALRWHDAAGTRVSALPQPAPHSITGDRAGHAAGRAPADGTRETAELAWELRVAPGEEAVVSVRVSACFPPPSGFEIAPPAARPAYGGVVVSCDDPRVERWISRSLQDVAALQLGTESGGERYLGTEHAGERYLGAGPPWYLTLFGRDSLISSGMLIPVDPGLAAGTLRALARWQGSKVDPDAAEQPGKIPHELRAEVADHGHGLVLPAAYYGTHDATQLWITTLHKAWRWGMPREQVEELLPNLQRALTWVRDHADPDGDGFLEYIDESGHGLANQGWKDSNDSVQWPDGTLATAPIALCEVQAYAYAAAVAGAELLTAFGLEGADEWLAWAANLKTRFREQFWVDGYPAIALDGKKRPVAGPSSNLGHLLGTGLLDRDEEATVAALLAGDHLNSGFGLRTLSTVMSAFNPLGYHTGSVWPHDTAMAIQGLYAAGHAATATTYVHGLLTAAEAFGYRLPELYGGAGAAAESTPTPYPLSCRPQAWAAASAIAVVVAALGIDPHVPSGTLDVTPATDFPWTTLRIDGLRVGERSLTVDHTNGKLTVHG